MARSGGVKDKVLVMDKAEIFTALTQRNALRKAAWLPLLDLTAEYESAVALEAWREYQAKCELFATDRARIREQVLAEFRAAHGPEFGLCFGGRWAVGNETNRRFQRFMSEVQDVPYVHHGGKNCVVYGGRHKDSLDQMSDNAIDKAT
jgi:hypothetical protein